jgi:hypothetical protein
VSDTTLVRMADILMPPPAHQDAAWIGWAVAALLLVLALLLWWWRWRRPIRGLERGLRRGRLTPRAAAHGLAALIPDDAAVRTELDRLRFRRVPPGAGDVARLIRQVADGR